MESDALGAGNEQGPTFPGVVEGYSKLTTLSPRSRRPHGQDGCTKSPPAARSRSISWGTVTTYEDFSSDDSLDDSLYSSSSSQDDDEEDTKLHPPSHWKIRLTKRINLVLYLMFVGLLCRSWDPNRPYGKRTVHDDHWGRRVPKDADKIRHRIQKSRPVYSFTIQLSASRLDLLRRSIQAHAECPSVLNLQVLWKSELVLSMQQLQGWSHKVTTSNKITSKAILLLDEDVLLTCDELERGFKLWRQNQDRLVGFFPFWHLRTERPYESTTRFFGWLPFLDPTTDAIRGLLPEDSTTATDVPLSLTPARRGSGDPYSLVSSRAAFCHRKYVKTFFATHKNETQCRDDVGLSIYTTFMSWKPPLAVAAQPLELKSSRGLSLPSSRSGTDWWKRLWNNMALAGQPESDTLSSKCLRYWMEAYGMSRLPVEESTYLGVV